MGFGLIFTGLMFLINPAVNIADIIPDLFGCVFIIAGLHKLSDTDGRFYNARTCAWYLAAVYAVKLVLSVYLPLYHRSGLLPATFVFGTAEAILLFAFFANLYGAVDYTLQRQGVTEQGAAKRGGARGGKRRHISVETARVTAFLFTAAKCLFPFLPESIELTLKRDPLDLSYHSAAASIAGIKAYALAICLVLSAIAGVAFALIAGRHLLSLKRDLAYNSYLYAKYKDKILDNQPLLARRCFRRVFALMIAGAAFLFDFILDGINLLPNFISYLLLLAALSLLEHHFGKKNGRKPVGAPLLLISVLTCAFGIVIHVAANSARNPEALFALEVPFISDIRVIVPAILLKLAEGALFVLLVKRLFGKIAAITFELKRIPMGRSVKSGAAASVLVALFSGASFVMSLFESLALRAGKEALPRRLGEIGFSFSAGLFLSALWMILLIFQVKRRVEFYL